MEYAWFPRDGARFSSNYQDRQARELGVTVKTKDSRWRFLTYNVNGG